MILSTVHPRLNPGIQFFLGADPPRRYVSFAGCELCVNLLCRQFIPGFQGGTEGHTAFPKALLSENPNRFSEGSTQAAIKLLDLYFQIMIYRCLKNLLKTVVSDLSNSPRCTQ